MKWLVFSAPLDGAGDDVLWYMRPFYNDGARPRKPEYQGLKLPAIPNGQVSVTRDGVTVTLDGATVNGNSIYSQTDEQRIDKWIREAIANPNIPLTSTTPHHLVEHTSIPADHSCGTWCEFRDAWEWSDGVKVNMPKARAIHLTEIRRVRNAELAKEDVTFMRAVEAGDTSAQSTAATKKQVLRDIPATFDITTGVTTPEALKAKWPTELPARE